MMKKAFLALIVAAFFIACNGKKADEHGHDHSDGTHQHEDGQAHGGDSTSLKQEEFTVENDTASSSEEGGHSHSEGSDHKH